MLKGASIFMIIVGIVAVVIFIVVFLLVMKNIIFGPIGVLA